MSYPMWILAVLLTCVIASDQQKTCSKNICEVFEKMETEAYTRKEFESNLDIFAIQNDLETGHKALKKVFENLGISVNLETNMPLQTYLIIYQKLIKEEAEIKFKTLMENESVHILQVINDFESILTKKMDSEFKFMKQSFLNAEDSLTKQLDEQTLNITQSSVASDSEINFDKKLNDVEKRLNNELKNKIDNITSIIFEDLIQMIKDVDAKVDKNENDEITKREQMFSDSEAKVIQMLEDHHVAVNHTLDQKLRYFEIKIMRTINDEILQLKQEDMSNSQLPIDCYDLQVSGVKKSGVHTIRPKGYHPIKVFCDMDNDGGGWTVFLNRQRQTIQENFKRNWFDYKNGFGSASGEYWMGNEALYMLTNLRTYTMRTDAEGLGTPSKIWGEYKKFVVGAEYDKYVLTLSSYNEKSTMYANGFDKNNGNQFTTFDRDNDSEGDVNCANEVGLNFGDGGGFWYHGDSACSYHIPTARYGLITFNYWSKTDENAKHAMKVQMKIRPQINT